MSEEKEVVYVCPLCRSDMKLAPEAKKKICEVKEVFGQSTLIGVKLFCKKCRVFVSIARKDAA